MGHHDDDDDDDGDGICIALISPSGSMALDIKSNVKIVGF